MKKAVLQGAKDNFSAESAWRLEPSRPARWRLERDLAQGALKPMSSHGQRRTYGHRRRECSRNQDFAGPRRAGAAPCSSTRRATVHSNVEIKRSETGSFCGSSGRCGSSLRTDRPGRSAPPGDVRRRGVGDRRSGKRSVFRPRPGIHVNLKDHVVVTAGNDEYRRPRRGGGRRPGVPGDVRNPTCRPDSNRDDRHGRGCILLRPAVVRALGPGARGRRSPGEAPSTTTRRRNKCSCGLTLAAIDHWLLVVLFSRAWQWPPRGSGRSGNLPHDVYPDISPPEVTIIPDLSRSAPPEEIERQLTIPIELAMSGVPYVSVVRSRTIYRCLSVVEMVFSNQASTNSLRETSSRKSWGGPHSMPRRASRRSLAPWRPAREEICRL